MKKLNMTEADKNKIADAMRRFFAFLERESEICPSCGEHVEACEQVGRCIYARPCGCRVVQGRLHENWKVK